MEKAKRWGRVVGYVLSWKISSFPAVINVVNFYPTWGELRIAV